MGELNLNEFDNLAILWGADARGVFCPLITNLIPDLHSSGGVATQCFPLFLFKKNFDLEQLATFSEE
jgi:hypothetical protein